jgi:hypothetical protein
MSFSCLNLEPIIVNISMCQLSPIPPVTLFSSPYVINQPSWCCKPNSLIVLQDTSSGKRYEIGAQPCYLIGRNEKSNVIIEDLLVSRCHAAILYHSDGSSYLMDLSSAHGTFIGDSRLAPYTPTIINRYSIIRFIMLFYLYILSFSSLIIDLAVQRNNISCKSFLFQVT